MAWKSLTDEQWALIEPHLPLQKMGRPRTRNREILDAILYVLSTGVRWEELPPNFPPKSTVHDRFQLWEAQGFFEDLFQQLKQKRKAVKDELYILDATIKSAKKGRVGRTSWKVKGYENKPRGKRSGIA